MRGCFVTSAIVKTPDHVGSTPLFISRLSRLRDRHPSGLFCYPGFHRAEQGEREKFYASLGPLGSARGSFSSRMISAQAPHTDRAPSLGGHSNGISLRDGAAGLTNDALPALSGDDDPIGEYISDEDEIKVEDALDETEMAAAGLPTQLGAKDELQEHQRAGYMHARGTSRRKIVATKESLNQVHCLLASPRAPTSRLHCRHKDAPGTLRSRTCTLNFPVLQCARAVAPLYQATDELIYALHRLGSRPATLRRVSSSFHLSSRIRGRRSHSPHDAAHSAQPPEDRPLRRGPSLPTTSHAAPHFSASYPTAQRKSRGPAGPVAGAPPLRAGGRGAALLSKRRAAQGPSERSPAHTTTTPPKLEAPTEDHSQAPRSDGAMGRGRAEGTERPEWRNGVAEKRGSAVKLERWREAVDVSSGRLYYYCESLGITQWDPPEDDYEELSEEWRRWFEEQRLRGAWSGVEGEGSGVDLQGDGVKGGGGDVYGRGSGGRWPRKRRVERMETSGLLRAGWVSGDGKHVRFDEEKEEEGEGTEDEGGGVERSGKGVEEISGVWQGEGAVARLVEEIRGMQDRWMDYEGWEEAAEEPR